MTTLAGTWKVVRGHLRTGWLALLLWPVALAGLVVGTASGIKALYPTPESRETYAATMGVSPASMAFNGRWHDLTSTGGITTYEVGFMGLLLIPPIALHLAISRTRAEEDSRRADLLTAGRVGRLATLAGTAITVTLALGLFTALTAAGLVFVGLPAAGSVWYATSLALFAWWFGALGLMAAQLGRTARTATGLGLAAALGMFLIRAVIDGRDLNAAWATPMGWLPEVRPFSEHPSALPLILFAGTGLALLAAAGGVALRRDLGAGVLAPRPGPAIGSAALGRPVGLVLRLTRGIFVGWLFGLVAWGVAIGTLTSEMADLVRANPGLGLLLGTGRPEDIVIALAAVLVALGGGALGLQGLGVLAAEETSARLGLVLASPRVRWRLWGAWWGVIAGEVALAMGLSALSLGMSTGVVTDDADAIGRALAACGAYLPAVLALIGFTALVLMVARGGLALGWVMLAWAAVVALLADTLRLPEWSRSLSVLDHVGRVPIESAATLALVVSAGVAVASFVGASVLGGERDLRAG